jgi:hypothetical protein
MSLRPGKHAGEISERGHESIKLLCRLHIFMLPSHHLRTIIYPDSFPIN